MKIIYRQAAREDVVKQFRYYLVTLNLPQIALRFRDSVRRTIQFLQNHSHVGPYYHSSHPQLQNLRSWPVTGFEAIRIYYLAEPNTIHVIRVLHGKRDVKNIISNE